MALIGQPDVAFCMLEGRPLHNITTTMSHKQAQGLEQSDGLGASDEAHSPTGDYKFDASIEGFYNTGAGLAQEGLELTGKQVLMYALAGNAIGDPFTGVDGIRASLGHLAARGTLQRIRADFKAATGPMAGPSGTVLLPRLGQILAPYATVTDVGPTNLATLDWGAGVFTNQETGSAVGFLGVSALTLDGGTHILFEIQDSADDINYVNLIVFANVAAAAAGEMKVQAAAVAPGDIERYTQLQYEFVGGAGAARTCTFAVGLVRSLT